MKTFRKLSISEYLERRYQEGLEQHSWETENPQHIPFPKAKFLHAPFLKVGNPFRSFAVIGGAGSGKSESVFKPIIASAVKQNSSIILYDYKNPELGDFLISLKPTLPIYRIDFNNAFLSDRINPIAPRYINTIHSALEFAQALYFNLNPKSITNTGDPFWDNSAISIIQATIWYLREEAPKECNIPTLVEFLLRPLQDGLNLISENETCRKLVASSLSSLDSTNLISSISSTVQQPLSRLIGNDIKQIMEQDQTPLDINDPNNPCILIIGMNEDNPSAYAPLISLIITACLKQMNKPNKHPSYIILDEAPTIYIPKIEDYPSVTRSRRISFVYGAQDISQIDKAYGKERRQALLSNLGTQFFGRTPNPETIKYMIDLFGKEDKVFLSTSKSSNSGSSGSFNKTSHSEGSSSSQSTSIQQREVLTPQRIINFYPGEFAFIGSDVDPSSSTQFVVSLSQFGNFGEMITSVPEEYEDFYNGKHAFKRSLNRLKKRILTGIIILILISAVLMFLRFF